MAPVAEAQVAHQDFDQPFDDCLVLRLFDARRHDGGTELRGHIGIARVQIGIVQVTLEHALLQAVGHGHVRHAAVEAVHAPMAAEPVAALHVIAGPGEQQLAEAEAGDKDPGLADLAALQLDPFDRIAGIVDLDTLAGLELAGRDRGFTQLRELAIKPFPEVAVGRQPLGFLLPQELQRVTQAQIVDDRRPVELRHPQWISAALGHIGRAAFPIAHFAHRAARAAQRVGNLPKTATRRQPSLDLLIPIHRHAPQRHGRLSFVVNHEACGSQRQRCDEDRSFQSG